MFNSWMVSDFFTCCHLFIWWLVLQLIFHVKNISRSRTASVAYCRSLCMMQVNIWPWSNTCCGHMVPSGSRVQMSQMSHFQAFSQLELRWLWPWYVMFDLANVWNFHVITKLDFNWTSTFKMRPILPLPLECILWHHHQMKVPMQHLWAKFS